MAARVLTPRCVCIQNAPECLGNRLSDMCGELFQCHLQFPFAAANLGSWTPKKFARRWLIFPPSRTRPSKASSTLWRERGVELVVVGGSAIEILTEGAYASGDLDDFLSLTNRKIG
jgi:hypothetical protein